MKLTGSFFSLAMCVTVACSPARAQGPGPVPFGPTPPFPPGMVMGGPVSPGGSAFPPSVATLAPDGSPAPANPAAAGEPSEAAAGHGLPCYPMPGWGSGPVSEEYPEALPMPTMIGSPALTFGHRLLQVRTRLTNETGPVFNRSFNDVYEARAPIVTRGAYKISEGDSPQPMTRFYYNFNYINDVRARFTYLSSFRQDLDGDTAGEITPFGGPLAQVNFKEVNVRRDTLGFECAFKENLCSIGIRFSMLDVQQDVETFVDPADALAANDDDATTTFGPLPIIGDIQHWELSDITVIAKAALCKNYVTGDIVSVGLAATIPTGHGFTSSNDDRRLRPGILQPFVGWLCTWGDWYLHGFTSAAIPTDSRDVYFLFNDVGIGYWCYKNECADDLFINGFVPTVELHVNTPLRNEGVDTDDPVGAPHTVVLTVGCHVFSFGWSSISGGIGTVLSGPKPYAVEATSQVNIRF